MGQDTSAFDAVLKESYEGPIREQLNEDTNLLDLFTKGEIEQYEWQGRHVIVPLHKSRNKGVKAIAEGGFLPVAGKQGYEKLTIPMRFIEGRIELTTQVMKAARNSKGAFAQAMKLEQEGLVNDLSRQRNRMLGYFGKGTLAVIATGVSSATQDLKDPGGVVGTVNPVRFIKPDMEVAITDSTGATLRDVTTVSSITDADTVVLADSVNTTTGDLVSLGSSAGSPESSSYNLEPMGLLGIVDGTTYQSSIHGLDRSLAANAFFKSQVLASVGAISQDILQRGMDNIEEVSGEVITDFLCHVSLRREIIKLTEADRRYAGGNRAQNFDAGTKAGAFEADLTFNNRRVKVDKDFAYGILLGVNRKHLFWIPETEGEWADEDGAVLSRVANKDAYEAFFRVYENFFSDKGNAHGRWDGVDVTVTSQVYAD